MSDIHRTTGNETIEVWLAALSATGPNPGGGAAAALMAGMAAALAEMVIAYRADRESDEAAVHARANRALAEALRTAAPSMADRDTEVSEGFSAAIRGDADREAVGVAAADSSVTLGRFAEDLVPVLRELAGQAGHLPARGCRGSGLRARRQCPRGDLQRVRGPAVGGRGR
jgi:hypothetical protein